MSDAEWDRWREDWGTADEPAPEIAAAVRRRALRQGRWQRLSLALQLLFYGAGLAYLTTIAVRQPRPLEVVTAVAVWGFVLAGFGGELAARRGLWRTEADSTRAFVDLSYRRCRARQWVLRFGIGMLIAEVLFFLPWIAWVVGTRPTTGSRLVPYLVGYGYLAVAVGVFVLYLRWYRKRVRRELAALEALRRALGEEGASGLSSQS